MTKLPASRRLLLAATLVAPLALAACATAASGEAKMSERAAERLAEFERTGDRQTCLSLSAIRQITPLDERHFLVRTGVNNYYLNEISGRCSNAGRAGYRIQYTTSQSQLCRNEIITVVDNLNGFIAGSCGLSDFQRLEKVPETDDEDTA
ncbi:MAG: DUF6491 family protein [Pseudomonadota bacterium]